MLYKNTQHNYGLVSILIHWTMALIIIALFILGKYMIDLDYYDTNYHKAPWWHKSIGLSLFALLLFRTTWKLINTSPQSISKKIIEINISKLVHILLYLLLFVCCVSGYLISTAEDAGVSFFNWFNIPALISKGADQADLAGDIHEYSTTILIITATFHMLAALKHHFINKNKTLIRMLTTK
jgi:cytochrome b561